MILVVGNLRRWERAGREVPVLEGFRFAAFDEVSPTFIDQVRPDVILSPLVEATFDAIDLARILGEIRYTGRYRAVTEPLPDPQAVLNEVRQVAPVIDFDIFVLKLSRP